MKCPKCNSTSVYVKDVLPTDDGKIYRCRRCSDCGFGFKTVEVIEADYACNYEAIHRKIIEYRSEEFKRGYSAAYYKKHPRRKT